MKNLKLTPFLLAIVFLSVTAITSCKKKEEEPDPETPSLESTEDNNSAQKEFDDVLSTAEDAMADQDSLMDKNGSASGKWTLSSNHCATVTVDTAYAVNGAKGRLVIDFGTTNCKGDDGRNRRGKIYVAYTGRYRDIGTVITTTFDGYHVNDIKVEGTKTVTHDTQLDFSVVVTGAKLTFTDATTITWESTRTRTWVEGSTTLFNIADDVYDITGSASGVNRSGLAFDITITKALRFKLACWFIWNFHPASGTLQVKPEGLATRTLDYGGGACDKKATVTVNGIVYDITLR